MAQQQTQRALTVAGRAQEALDEAPIDPRLLMAAKAIQLMAGQDDQGYPKISADMALAAAMYQAGTGQMLGRDFYVNDKQGRMEGYRGVARDANERGVGEVQIKYRSLTTQEADDNEIKPGDVAVACEVYQLRAWERCQRLGIRYEPVVGIGILWAREKINSYGKPISLAGGMTWRKKAQNRAYKDALRHTPGMPASPEEVIADNAMHLDELPPEAARLTMEQAQAWVDQHGVDGSDEPDGVTEGQFTEQRQPEQQNGAQQASKQQAQDPPGFAVWADWTNANDAKAWAMTQGKFNASQHMEHAYAKVKTDCAPKTAREMWQCWWKYVTEHAPAKAQAADAQPDDDPDGWQEIDANGVDEPRFN